MTSPDARKKPPPKPHNSKTAAKRQWLVKVHGVEGKWAQKTGGEVTADTTKVWNGGEHQPEVLAGPAQCANVVVSRPYNLLRDEEMLRDLSKRVGQKRFNISVHPTNVGLGPEGAIHQVFSDALLVGVTRPETDASSADASTCSLEFAIGNWT